MTSDLPPLPAPAMRPFVIGDCFTADQMHAFRAEGERLARLQALEDAALACEAVAGGKCNQQPHRECAAAIRQLKDRT